MQSQRKNIMKLDDMHLKKRSIQLHRMYVETWKSNTQMYHLD